MDIIDVIDVLDVIDGYRWMLFSRIFQDVMDIDGMKTSFFQVSHCSISF